jgi:mRNA interferase MazF
MGQPVRGDVVVVPFPFTNLSAGKVRPALVIAAPLSGEAVLCQITTTQRNDGYSISLTSADFAQGKLDHDCCGRVSHLFTIATAAIQRTRGQLKPDKTAAIINAIVKMLQS